MDYDQITGEETSVPRSDEGDMDQGTDQSGRYT